MGNSTSAGQGNYTTYGSQDVEGKTEQEQHWPTELAVEPDRKSYSLFPTDPTLYNGAHNVGLEPSEVPNLPNSTNSTEERRQRTTDRHRRCTNNEASDNGFRRGAFKSLLPNPGVQELAEHPNCLLPNLSIQELAESPRSSLPNSGILELVKHPNRPNSLTAEDESTSEFLNSTTSNDLRRGATETNCQQKLEYPNSHLNSEKHEQSGSTVRHPVRMNYVMTNMPNPNSEQDPDVRPNGQPSGAYTNYVWPSIARANGTINIQEDPMEVSK